MSSAPSEKTLPSIFDFSSKAVLCLIEAVGRRWALYETRERSQLFQSVQEEMAAKGHALPVEKIRRKWNNLIVTYKRVKDRSRETGHAKTSWEFFDLMDATLSDTVGAQVIVSNKRPKGGPASSSLPGSSAKSPLKTQPSLPPTAVRPNGDFIPATAAANSVAAVAAGVSVAAATSFEVSSTRQTSRKTPSYPPGVAAPFRTSGAPNLLKVSTSPSFASTRLAIPVPTQLFTTAKSKASNLHGRRGGGSQGGATVGLQEALKRQEDHAHLEWVARRRLEAREKRRERREVRMAESLGRIATALELLSSKQDTVIALLQRLADRK